MQTMLYIYAIYIYKCTVCCCKQLINMWSIMEALHLLFQDILKSILAVPANFFIQGGYFETAYGATDFSFNSFNSAIALRRIIQKSHLKNRMFSGVLVNNFGQDCDEAICSLKEPVKADDEAIEQEINSLIIHSRIKNASLTITKETTLKNRGLRMIRQMFKDLSAPIHNQAIIYKKTEMPTWYMRSKFGDDIALFDKYEDNIIAKCPIIMGTYYSDMLRKLETTTTNPNTPFVLLDFCSYKDKATVTRGVEVAFTLFNEKLQGTRKYYILPILCDIHCSKMILLKFSSEQFNLTSKVAAGV